MNALPVPNRGAAGTASLKTLLVRAAASTPNPSVSQQEILGKLDALQARIDEGLLRVAVLGQFKRGKSTLLNALLGAPLLPAGVIPVTAIPTFIRAGAEAKARIGFLDGKAPLMVSGESGIKRALDQAHFRDAKSAQPASGRKGRDRVSVGILKPRHSCRRYAGGGLNVSAQHANGRGRAGRVRRSAVCPVG
jgi:Dynamin family